MIFNIADLFETVADAVPDRPALVGGQVRLTFRELDERANRVANYLHASNVDPGSLIGILARNRVEWLEIMIGCFKCRVVPINLNHRYLARELRYVVEDADLVGVVFERSFTELVRDSCSELSHLQHLLVMDDDRSSAVPLEELPVEAIMYEDVLPHHSQRRDDLPARSSDDLYVLYTGGTTGTPKGVVWRQEDLYLGPLGGSVQRGGPPTSAAMVASRLSRTDAHQIVLVVPPMMHGTGQWTSLGPLLAGSTVVLYCEPRFSAAEVWRKVEREHITLMVMVGDVMGRPLALELDTSPDVYDTSSLSIVVSSGAPLSTPVREELLTQIPHLRIINRLGSSESGTIGADSDSSSGRTATTGPQFAVSGETAVLDDELLPLSPGDGRIGRLARRGFIPLGYHNDPEKTTSTFVTDPDGVRWVLPGDFASVLDGGKIALLGRGSTTINSGGEKVFPQEVEAVLKSHPLVFDAIVVGIPDERYGEGVAAVVQPRNGSSLTLEGLAEHCRSSIAGYKVPRKMVLVDEIPLTPVGKPDHSAARSLLVD